MTRDPLKHPEELIRRVYSYVAFRIGPGPDAEDVTSETMLRAVRYRSSYDSKRGKPISWLIGIARTCVDDHFTSRRVSQGEVDDVVDREQLEAEVVERIDLANAVARLDRRDQELIALRYGADLSTREIGKVLGMTGNAVDVALHRSRQRLRAQLETDEGGSSPPSIRLSRPQANVTG